MAVVGDVEVTMTGDARGLNSAMKSARKSTDGMKKSTAGLTKAMGALAGVFGVGMIAKGIFEVNRESQKLMASLKTLTGSTKNAAVAFRFIEEVAQRLPETVADVGNAFKKMTALGLEPSSAALISYGNTAAAMGKSLDQMIEAVADAATGEFERLKEFGIKASAQGDNITFTFQGIATTVKKNAADISTYLQSIGDVQFAGAAADQMATIDGALSNMGDSFAGVARAIGEAGLNALIIGMAKFAGRLAEKIRDNSGAIKEFITFAISMGKVALAAATAFGVMTLAMGVMKIASLGLTGAIKKITTAVRALSATSVLGILALVTGLVAEQFGLVDKALNKLGITVDEVTGDEGKGLAALEAELARISAENASATVALGKTAGAFTEVATATKKALTPMQQFEKSAANMVSGTLNQLLDIAFVFDGMADNISRATSAVGELTRELVKLAAKKAIMALVNNLAGGGPGLVSSAAGGIKKFFGFANGGIISEPTAMVGMRSGNLGMMAERGPEAIVPLGGRGGGGMALTVNVYGSVGVDDIGEQLVNHLRTKGI